MVNDILHQPTNTPEDNDEVRAWLNRNLDLPSNSHKQRNWDDIQCSSAITTLVPLLNQNRLACFKVASLPESAACLNCIPDNRDSTFIDNYPLCIGVALSVFIPHRCSCETTVDAFVTHLLSCRFNAGRICRHSALNDVVQLGLYAAGLRSGLDRGDGKRPEGISVYPYSRNRCIIWDATSVNTLAYFNLTRAAFSADVRKNAKYAVLGRRIIFQPVELKTSGTMGNGREV